MTFSYLKKNFLLPVLAMLIPAVAACFLYTPYWEVSFVAAFDADPYRRASETFLILFGDSWQYVWPVILVAVTQVVGAALIVSAMDRHFRTGKLSFKSPWQLINISVFPMAIGVALMSAVSILVRLLMFGLVSLVQVTFGAMSAAPGMVLAVISAIAVGVFFLHVLALLPMLMWTPVMFIYGYKFRDAAAMSYKMIAGKKLFWSLFLPMLLCAGVQLLVGFLQVHLAIAVAVSFVIFLFTNVYTTVYTMIVFYDISDLDRRDIQPYKLLPVTPSAPAEKAAKTEPQEIAEPKKPKKSGAAKTSKKPKKEDDNVL
ncbi:MAG: hypothetical protein J1F71_01715 [Clostridiales bacterium]|nr:hypothetical protein [Clostridiales bacterium]